MQQATSSDAEHFLYLEGLNDLLILDAERYKSFLSSSEDFLEWRVGQIMTRAQTQRGAF